MCDFGMILWMSVLATGPASASSLEPSVRGAAPESRAVAFLAGEVPRWSPANKCFSCHNNGDAARALYTARRLGVMVEAKVLDDTTAWLSQPARWDRNGGDGTYNDRVLMDIQFAAALAEATAAGMVKERKALLQAADMVAKHQRKDGSWKIDGEDTVGAPASYGIVLATAQARQILFQADPQRYRPALQKADAWLRRLPVKNVFTAAAVLLALADNADAAAAAQKKHGLDLIRKGQSRDSGWGPYVTSPPEPFDTALVLLALARFEEKQDEHRSWLKSGRAYLIASQQPDGGWPATTRPAGADSYAQRISTSAWATLALLATRP